MLYFESGSIFVGFTAPENCLKCNNKNPHLIREKYTKQTLIFIPLGTSSDGIIKCCSVCHKEEKIKLRSIVFNRDVAENKLQLILHEGKDYTKYWFDNLNDTAKIQYLKTLNKLSAYDMVLYLKSHE